MEAQPEKFVDEELHFEADYELIELGRNDQVHADASHHGQSKGDQQSFVGNEVRLGDRYSPLCTVQATMSRSRRLRVGWFDPLGTTYRGIHSSPTEAGKYSSPLTACSASNSQSSRMTA